MEQSGVTNLSEALQGTFLPPQGGVDPRAHKARINDFIRQIQQVNQTEAEDLRRSASPLDNKTLDATSLSQFLPSFLETSREHNDSTSPVQDAVDTVFKVGKVNFVFT